MTTLLKKKASKKTATKKATKKAKTIETVTLKGLVKDFNDNLKIARKNKLEELVVLTTNRSHYNENIQTNGIGSDDLKPVYKDFYKKLLIENDIFTRPVNLSTQEIAWVVKVK